MKTRLLVLLLIVGSTMFAATRIVVGVGIGVGGPGYYAPAPVVAYAPPCPGPGYYWVPGYRYRIGPRILWRGGYWAHRPYVRGHIVGPRYNGHFDNRYRNDRDDRNWRR